jgi:hypothetical protein
VCCAQTPHSYRPTLPFGCLQARTQAERLKAELEEGSGRCQQLELELRTAGAPAVAVTRCDWVGTVPAGWACTHRYPLGCRMYEDQIRLLQEEVKRKQAAIEAVSWTRRWLCPPTAAFDAARVASGAGPSPRPPAAGPGIDLAARVSWRVWDAPAKGNVSSRRHASRCRAEEARLALAAQASRHEVELRQAAHPKTRERLGEIGQVPMEEGCGRERGM